MFYLHTCLNSSNFVAGITTSVVPVAHIIEVITNHTTIKTTITMKKRHFLWLLASLLLLAVPVVQTSAFDDEVEIELFEVAGVLPGDSPLDDAGQSGYEPTQPTDFQATIAGRTLAVTSGIHSGRLIVRNSAGTQVVNQTFAGGTTAQVAAGSYSIEIQSGSLTLVGLFSAH